MTAVMSHNCNVNDPGASGGSSGSSSSSSSSSRLWQQSPVNRTPKAVRKAVAAWLGGLLHCCRNANSAYCGPPLCGHLCLLPCELQPPTFTDIHTRAQSTPITTCHVKLVCLKGQSLLQPALQALKPHIPTTETI